MTPEFKFDGSQDYQLDAIAATVALFEGQPFVGKALVPAAGSVVVPNRLDLDDAQLLANLQAVQAERELPQSTELACIEQQTELYDGLATARFPNFSIEMETGTGKTYVYLRTILELARRYGLRKFVIVVPSIAVREGVWKTIQQTRKHFASLPDTVPFHAAIYDSAETGQVRSFTSSTAVEVLIMTIDAFARAQTVIRKSREGNAPPIHSMQAVRPVLILDEPQNMESENRVAALAMLHPLFALRYSATHKNAYNLAYRLSPFDAYRRHLVKRIEVAAAVEEQNANLPYVRLESIDSAKRTLSARVIADVQRTTGKVDRTAVTLSNRKGHDDLAAKTRRTDYEGFELAEISLAGGYVRFKNGVEITTGSEVGSQREAVIEAQIAYTVQKHFQNQRRFNQRGLNVKVLSLFFIDKVESYARDDGLIRKLFIKAFDEAKAGYDEWRDKAAMDVQASYFATIRKKGGGESYVEKEAATNDAERAAQAREFDLIMRRKEQLLSFDEPVAFIFSHSALKEGWDNPNVFQICTLREVGTENERRQQVGRGVRLAVDTNGDRVRDDSVNILTVVASESYQQFVDRLQSETIAAVGEAGAPPKPANARERVAVMLRKQFLLKPEFQALWERIKHRTRYAVEVDGPALVDQVVAALADVVVQRPRVVVQVAGVRAAEKSDLFEAIMQAGAAVAIDLEGRYPLPNVVCTVEDLMAATSPPMRLPRSTILAILARAPDPAMAMANPHEFAVKLVTIIKDNLAAQMVGSIKYEKDGSWYEQTQFADVMPSWSEYLVASEEHDDAGGTHLYDHVIVDSETIERPFAEGLERDRRVKLYVKLPRWFEVATPLGAYQPDWAIVMQEPDGGEELYLVRETKPTLTLTDLRIDEQRKIKCGRAHFVGALGVSFKVVTQTANLPFGGV